MAEEAQKPEQQPIVQQPVVQKPAAPVAPAEDVNSLMMPLFISTIVLASVFSFAVDGISKYFPETPRADPSIAEKIDLAPK